LEKSENPDLTARSVSWVSSFTFSFIEHKSSTMLVGQPFLNARTVISRSHCQKKEVQNTGSGDFVSRAAVPRENTFFVQVLHGSFNSLAGNSSSSRLQGCDLHCEHSFM
jgi:hypothetical protein